MVCNSIDEITYPNTSRKDGTDSFEMSFTLRVVRRRIPNTLLIICVSVLLGTWFVRSVGRIVGWYLRRHASPRRKAILRRVKIEEEATQSFNRRNQRPESDDDWERIDSFGVGSAINGGPGDEDWEGIIGFFHPFWFVTLIASIRTQG